MDVFECGAVLFESADDEEMLRIECAMTLDGELQIVQESDGPMTSWCFEESPHRVEVAVSASGVRELLAHFHIDVASMLPAVLRMEYTGYTCFQCIRQLAHALEIPYTVYEDAIVR